MILRSCRWTPLGPYTVQVPVAGGPSTFVAEQASAVVTDGTTVVVSAFLGLWRRSDRPLGPWSRATQFPTSLVGEVALVGGQPIFTVLNQGVADLVVGDTPMPAPPGTDLDSRLFVGAAPGEVLLQTAPGTMISRDGGQSFDPLWPGRNIQSAAPVGADRWAVSEFGRVHLATGSTLVPAGVGVLPDPATLGAQIRTTVVSAPADRSTVWAVFALVDLAGFSLTLFAVFVSLDGGVGWTPVVAPRSLAVAPTAAVYLENNDAALVFGRGLPAGVDPLAGDRLVLGLDQVWEVRRGATERVLFAQSLLPRALVVTEERVWAATEFGVQSIDRIVGPTSRWVERDRGRGAPEPTQGGTHHQGVASFVVGEFTQGIARSRAHPVWVRVHASSTGVAIRETLRQLLISGFGGLEVAEAFVPPLRPLHGGESSPQLARAPGDDRIAWFGGQRLFRLEGDVVRPVVEFDRHNPTSDFMWALSVSPTDPNRVFVLLSASIVRVDFALTGSTATLIPLPVGIQGFSRAIAAGITDNRAVYLTVGSRSTAPPGSEPRIWRWDPNQGQWDDLTATVGEPGRGTPLTAVAVLPQPGGPDRILVGGTGVWETRDLGVTWVSIGHGLPAVEVAGLAVHEGARRIRAFTEGRGAWERDLDIPPCASTPHEVELYLRSHDLDDGGRATVVDPFDGRTLTFEDAAGLRVDARAASKAGEPASFQRPIDEPEWGVDTVAFPQLENRALTAGARARIYVEAHNRGPDVASPVCWVAWAPLESGALPRVQESFWHDFPGDTLFSGPWKVVGMRSIPALQPAVPDVFRISWDVPADAPRDIGLIAVLHSSEDPVFEGINPGAMERDPTALARVNRRVLVRKVKVAPGPPPRVDPAEQPEPGEPPEESKLGYWIVGGVVVALIVVGTVWIASGNFGDD